MFTTHSPDFLKNFPKDDDGNTLLHLAAMYGRIEHVEYMCASGMDHMAVNNENKQAIVVALDHSHYHVADWLWRATGATLTVFDDDKDVHRSIWLREKETNIKTYLAAAKAGHWEEMEACLTTDPAVKKGMNEMSRLAIFLAIENKRYNVVENLVNGNLHCTTLDSIRSYAAAIGNLHVIFETTPDDPDVNLYELMTIAVRHGNRRTLTWLWLRQLGRGGRAADESVIDTQLWTAALLGHVDMVRWLARVVRIPGEIVERLVTRYNDPTPEISLTLLEQQNFPLKASYEKYTKIVKILMDNVHVNEKKVFFHILGPIDLVTVKMFLDHEDMSSVDSVTGDTVLTHTIRWNSHLPVVKWLVEEKNLDPNVFDRHGFSPLMWAFCDSPKQDDFEVGRWLLKEGHVNKGDIQKAIVVAVAGGCGFMLLVTNLVEIAGANLDGMDIWENFDFLSSFGYYSRVDVEAFLRTIFPRLPPPREDVRRLLLTSDYGGLVSEGLRILTTKKKLLGDLTLPKDVVNIVDGYYQETTEEWWKSGMGEQQIRLGMLDLLLSGPPGLKYNP
jgi:ankyrin repeat protein